MFDQPPRPAQLPTLSGTENEYRPRCDDAVQLESKDKYRSFHLWMHVCVAVKTV